jgi:hypothetical protein
MPPPPTIATIDPTFGWPAVQPVVPTQCRHRAKL